MRSHRPSRLFSIFIAVWFAVLQTGGTWLSQSSMMAMGMPMPMSMSMSMSMPMQHGAHESGSADRTCSGMRHDGSATSKHSSHAPGHDSGNHQCCDGWCCCGAPAPSLATQPSLRLPAVVRVVVAARARPKHEYVPVHVAFLLPFSTAPPVAV